MRQVILGTVLLCILDHGVVGFTRFLFSYGGKGGGGEYDSPCSQEFFID